jgi:hypothetical protein
MTGLYFNLWAPAVLVIWLHVRFVLPEEEFLRAPMGEAYLLYASGTSRWLGVPGSVLLETNAHGTQHGMTRSITRE